MASDMYFQVPDDLMKDIEVPLLFPILMHKDYEISTRVVREAEEDFNRAMNFRVVTGSLAQVDGLADFHFVPIAIPEASMERLELITAIMEGALIHDGSLYSPRMKPPALTIDADYYDMVDHQKLKELTEHVRDALSMHTAHAGDHVTDFRLQQWRARNFLKMLKIDRENTIHLMKVWSAHVNIVAEVSSEFVDLDDFFAKRYINAGMLIWESVLYFSMDVHVSDKERERLQKVLMASHNAIAFLNDYYSWPKEAKHAIENPSREMPYNMIPLLMRTEKISESEAYQRLTDIIVQLQKEYKSLVEELEAEMKGLPASYRTLLLAGQCTITATAFWSHYCPRYPKKADLNQPEVVLVDGKLAYKDGSNARSPPENTEQGCPKMKSELPSTIFDEHANRDITHGGLVRVPSLSEKSNGDSKKNIAGFHERSGTALMAPLNYLSSLPSRQVREKFIDALDWWLDMDESAKVVVKDLVKMLHHASLMLDDIQDDSKLRRGKPATHLLYGPAQTINAATYTFTRAFSEAQKLQSTSAVGIFLEEVQNLHRGQSLDLYWKHHVECPTEDEYMMMADNKTGGLFRLCARLVQAVSRNDQYKSSTPNGRSSLALSASNAPEVAANLECFVTKLGRFFQIRDDYCNLASDEYANQKGFAEDLDEGKFSLPLIYTLNAPNAPRVEILSLLRHREPDSGLPIAMKHYILDEMKRTGALDATRAVLTKLQNSLFEELKVLEEQFRKENSVLMILLESLRIC